MEIECLRSSPDRSRSRRQSPSPTRSSVPQPRTPRSPRTERRQRRLRCRNTGCIDHFIRADTRLRHELHHCRYRNDVDQVKLFKIFFNIIVTHILSCLFINYRKLLQCRVLLCMCLALYKVCTD